MIKDNYLHIIIDDLIISFIYKNKKTKIFLPYGIIQDGQIMDLNYLYYLLKKHINQEKLYSNIHLIINSSKILFLNHEIPKIDKSDIDSMLKYEIENKFSISIEDYNIKYKINSIDKNINLSIFLFEKDLLKSYENLFLKLQMKIKNINYLGEFLLKDESINIFFNLEKIIIGINTKNKKIIKYFINNNLIKLFKENNLDLNLASKIMDNQIIDDKLNYTQIKDDILILTQNLIYYIKNYLNQYGNNISIQNNTFFKKTHIENLFKEFQINELDINFKNLSNDINLIEKKKFNISIYSYLIIGVLIINLVIFTAFKLKNIRDENYIKLKYSKIKNKNNKRKYEIKPINEELKNILFRIPKNNDEILITQIIYEDNELNISGKTKDIKYIKEIFKNLNYNINIVEDEGINFVITFKLKD